RGSGRQALLPHLYWPDHPGPDQPRAGNWRPENPTILPVFRRGIHTNLRVMSTLRRIQRESSHEEFVKDLTTGEKPLFREIWRLLLLAAAIGVKDGARTPLGPVDSGKAMPET